MSKKPSKNQGFFKSITGALDDVINEVKADINAMTPPDPKVDPRKAAEEKALEQKLRALAAEGSRGLAENRIPGMEYDEEIDLPEEPKAQPKTLPTGNLWQALKDMEVTGRLHGDACYHALTVADVEQYLHAIANQREAPFTLGLVAVNMPALTEEEVEQEADIDILTMAMLIAVMKQQRIYGALGAGPRQLWSNLEKLDERLTHILNEHPKIIALGPLGIDEPFAPYTVGQQQAQLELQLDIAAEFNLPVLLTQRKSLLPLSEVLVASKNLPKLVYMDVLNSLEELELVKKFNMSVTLRPEVTQPDFAEKGGVFYQEIAEDKLLLASGSALVAPHGFQGHFNQPKFLHNSLLAACKLLTYSERKLLSVTNANLANLFPQI